MMMMMKKKMMMMMMLKKKKDDDDDDDAADDDDDDDDDGDGDDDDDDDDDGDDGDDDDDYIRKQCFESNTILVLHSETVQISRHARCCLAALPANTIEGNTCDWWSCARNTDRAQRTLTSWGEHSGWPGRAFWLARRAF